MMIARPTAASPAATVITNMANTWPSSDERRCENATRFTLTALSISSIAISTVIMLRRMITPISPTANRVPESIRYASVLGTHRLLDFLLRLDAIEDEIGRGLFFDRRELALSDDDRADHGDEKKERGNLERHQILPIQRHPDRFRVADDSSATEEFPLH